MQISKLPQNDNLKVILYTELYIQETAIEFN